MDWGIFFEKYSESLFALGGVCLGTGASFMTLLAGYVFQKWNDERKRKWELENIEINRRISAKDKRIQEAQAYIEAYEEAIHLLGRAEMDIIKSRNGKVDWENFERAGKLIKFTAKRKVSISLLDDAELHDLEIKLIARFEAERRYALDLEERVTESGTVDVKDLFGTGFINEMDIIIGKMQRRIEALIETME